MAWIESHQSLGTHLKLRRLARELRIHRATAIGHLQFLWWWALDNAPTGDLSALAPAEIEEAAEWSGVKDAFVTALRTHGWLDPDGMIHDWHDYAGKLVEKRESDRERKREARRKDVQRTSSGHPADGARTAQVPNPTQPNPTVQYPTTNPPSPPAPPMQPDPLELPEQLKTAGFVKAWGVWMNFRRGMKNKPKDWATLFRAQLDMLAKYDAETATEILNKSIRGGWQGLFEPNERSNGNHNRSSTTAGPGSTPVAVQSNLSDRLRAIAAGGDEWTEPGSEPGAAPVG